MRGVIIGTKHSFNDWGLYLGKETSISFPEIKENIVDVPGADNEIDLTEVLTGDVKYKPRKIKIVLWEKGKTSRDLKLFLTEIANYLHGQKLKITFDTDPGYYYIGRCTLNPIETDRKVGKIVIDVKAEAYKYYQTSTIEDWIWDSFNFEEGIIQEYVDLEVDETLELNLYNSRMKVIPIFTVSDDMEIEFKNKTYELSEGINEISDIELEEGENEVTIIGNGTVSIEYRRGCL